MNRGSERRGGEGREWKVCERTLRGAIIGFSRIQHIWSGSCGSLLTLVLAQ